MAQPTADTTAGKVAPLLPGVAEPPTPDGTRRRRREPQATTPVSPVEAWVARHRVRLALAYAVLTGALVALFGGPDRPAVLWWTVGALVVVCAGRTHPLARFLLAWLPLLVILACYDLIRSQAGGLIERAHVEPQLSVDEWIGRGTAPSVTLQRDLYTPHHLEWYDVAAFLVYITHFLAAIAIALTLWFRARSRFPRFAALMLGFSLAGFATYVIYPAIPPWLASREGFLPHTTRAVYVIWGDLGLHGLAEVFSGDPKYSNPVGALPSEHAAYPLLFLLFFWGITRYRWQRALLVAYVVVMAFALVYLGEHYVADILLGWIYAVGAYVLLTKVADARAARRSIELALDVPDG